jgi:parallel beta-helix repeat protein
VRDTTYEIRDCTLRENWESAISIWESQGVSIGNCRVQKNKGSGIRFHGSAGGIFGGEVSDNEGYEGAGVALVDSRMVFPIRNVLFSGNRAMGSTGGAFNAADTSDATIANCTFRRNASDIAGGAVGVMSGSMVNLSRSFFETNHAPTAGAVHVDHAGLNVGYSVFDRNSSKAFAAAIGVLGRKTANVNPIFANNTFYRNSVTGDGATLFFTDVSPEVRKNIFVVVADQRAVSGLQTSPRYDCNLIWDPSGGAVGALPSANTWVGDPLFCDAGRGDFKLRDLSPALRAPCGPIGALSEKPGCSTFRLQPAN